MTPSPPPAEVTVPEARELARAWASDLDAVAGEMYAFLAARIPEATADAEIAALTRASCVSNIEAVVSMIRHGIPASATEAPVAALEHARRMAARGGGVDATLRFYRLGHAFFWEQWSAALVEAVPDRDRLVVALQETAAFVFHYIDQISARVGAEHVAERERRQRRAAVVRADLVRGLLAGEEVDAGTAERTLAHPLAGPQLAVVLWTDGDATGGLERGALALASAAGAARPLLVPDGPRVLGVWVAGAAASADLTTLAAAVAEAAPAVHLASGGVHAGLAGFRRSREEADRARRVAALAGRRPPTATDYADVAVVDLLTRDLAGARAFARDELGALGADDPATARAREALLAVVSPQGGIAAAARELGVHRNTVLGRVRRAEELRGAPATERPVELFAALLVAVALGRLDDPAV